MSTVRGTGQDRFEGLAPTQGVLRLASLRPEAHDITWANLYFKVKAICVLYVCQCLEKQSQSRGLLFEWRAMERTEAKGKAIQALSLGAVGLGSFKKRVWRMDGWGWGIRAGEAA